mmetsp:Transcript_114175/g.355559  ORF Transcript_114175/g.355559 Transcript_114175/m.355559 type:complete len:153 (+) Transcript_114175:22-480(+)
MDRLITIDLSAVLRGPVALFLVAGDPEPTLAAVLLRALHALHSRGMPQELRAEALVSQLRRRQATARDGDSRREALAALLEEAPWEAQEEGAPWPVVLALAEAFELYDFYAHHLGLLPESSLWCFPCLEQLLAQAAACCRAWRVVWERGTCA